MNGHKDILGVWIGENESSKFWLSVMNDLRNRRIKDVYVFCVDGLTSFREAINEDEAIQGMMEFKDKWAKTYPSCVRSWEEN